MSAILAFIGVKLVLHWAHGIWEGVPTVPTLTSLGVIVAALSITTATSLWANRRDARRQARARLTTSSRPDDRTRT